MRKPVAQPHNRGVGEVKGWREPTGEMMFDAHFTPLFADLLGSEWLAKSFLRWVKPAFTDEQMEMAARNPEYVIADLKFAVAVFLMTVGKTTGGLAKW